jgi:PfaD family protein
MIQSAIRSEKNSSALPASAENLRVCAQELCDLASDLVILKDADSIAFARQPQKDQLAFAPAVLPESLGDPSFRETYHTRYALYTGAMANGIASEELVIAMGRAGMMGSFGAGGLLPERIERAIEKIKAALPNGPFAFNLINSPNEPALEARTAELYIKHDLPVIEASAYLGLTVNLVWYRASGLSQNADGRVQIQHHIIAKVSRKEVARRFLEPAPEDLLKQLLVEGKITAQQAELARSVPMADDITVEADSGGHTDNRPLVNAFPAIQRQRDAFQEKYNYAQPVRIGAAGGISTPEAALAAFMMGAAYVTTGSINQACLEAAASEYTRKLLQQAEMTDVAMAPASDMFEMGVRVQVLKRGTMFAMRGQKLYEIYSRFNSIDDIPDAEREKLETSTFQMPLEAVWQECLKFFTARDPRQIERAEKDPHAKMALIFRWYLGLSSRWSNIGEKGREMDYQVWCGPAMGAFNDWVKGSYLEQVENRHAADANLQILTGAAYLLRLRFLERQGMQFHPSLAVYIPQQPLIF